MFPVEYQELLLHLDTESQNHVIAQLYTLKEVKECVFKTKIPLEIAISAITSNPADILRLKGKGKVEEGYDADLCILDAELQLVEVIAKGNTVYTK